MPESKGRKAAAEKKTAKRKTTASEAQQKNKLQAQQLAGGRDWVPWVFISLGLFGVAWIVVYSIVGGSIPFMVSIGHIWNYAIGMGAIAAAFVVATFWK